MNGNVQVNQHHEVQNGVEQTRGGRFYRPNVEIQEREAEIVLVADMPGVAGDGVDVRYDSGELTLHGHVRSRQSDDQQYLLQEYATGDYFRTFRVSEKIDPTRIHAECSAGVLTVYLPKAEAAKPRRIPVAAR